MKENERVVTHFIERINEETGETQIMAWNAYQGTFRTVNEMNSSDAFEDSQAATQIAAWMNNIDDKVDGKHYYYRVASDNQTRRIIADDAPQSVKDFFADEETSDGTDNTEQQPAE